MFCIKCGEENALGSFCKKCGGRLEREQTVSASQDASNQTNAETGSTSPPPKPYASPAVPPPGYYPGSGQSGSKGKMIVPVVAGLLLIAAVIAVFLLFRDGESSAGGSLVGEWEIVEFREYMNGQLDMATSVPVHLRDEGFEFMENGDFYLIEGRQRHFMGTWISTGDNRIIIRDDWERLEWEYSLRGQELTISAFEEWWGDTFETILTLNRVR